MIPMTVGEFARRSGATISGIDLETLIFGFALDSREVRPGSLFLAVKGANVDGHDFVDDAIRNGAVTALVEREVFVPHLYTSNLVQALARMALSIREEMSVPVVGVTGSAGKTTTKEFLAAALSPLGAIGKTEGNRNTEYSAPLMWAELHGGERAVVVEMSMRGFGQIAHLAAFSKPIVGIVTNVGSNHAQMVGSIEGVAQAKAELLESLPASGSAIVWHEDRFADFLIAKSPCPTKTFGFAETADAQVVDYRPLSWTRSDVRIRLNGTEVAASIPVAGRHFALNAAAAMLAATRCGVDPKSAAEALSAAQLPAMRMQPIESQGVTIVLDNYNAAPQSFVAALETLAELPTSGRRIVVAGEMRELGVETESGHRAVGAAIATTKVDRAIFFGEAMGIGRESAIASGMPDSAIVVAASLDDIRNELRSVRSGDTVLVKGSRALELERALDGILDRKEASAH